MDEARRVAQHLIRAIQRLRQENEQFPGRHVNALEKLSRIFQEQTGHVENLHLPSTPTSVNPTGPREIRQAPRTHQRVTRSNTPGLLPAAARTLPPLPTAEGARATSEGEKRKASEEGLTTEGGQGTQGTPRPAKRRSPRLNQNHQAQRSPTIFEEVIHQTATPSHACPTFRTPRMITQEAINIITTRVWNKSPAAFLPRHLQVEEDKLNNEIDIEEFCAPVTHPTTGEVTTKY